jgi:hypothetical protein
MRKTILVLGSVMAVLMFAMVGAGVALSDTVLSTSSPTTEGDCKNGGYAKYGFKNQGQCIKAVNHATPADTTAPDVSITSGPGDTEDHTVEFTFESSDPTATFECALEPTGGVVPEGFGPCPAYYSSLPAGDYVFKVRATDPAGNVSAVASRSFTVPDTSVSVNITNAPTSQNNEPYPLIERNDYSFEFDTTGPVVSVTCTLSERTAIGDPTPANDTFKVVEQDTNCQSPKTYTDLPDGVYKFEVLARNSQGNGGGHIVGFTVDITP